MTLIRGEAIRLFFAAAGVIFEDFRIKEEDWPALKKTFEWGQLPLLEVGDKTLTQSNTIYRYLARKFKMIGADDWEAAKCEELVDAVGDLTEELIGIEWRETDPTKKQQRKEKFSSEMLPNFLSRINKIQNANGGLWLVGNNMTWADIVIAEQLRQFGTRDWNKTDLSAYPHVRKMQEAVFANEGIEQFRISVKK